MKRVIICGSRHWDDRHIVEVVVTGLACHAQRLTIIEGGAPGADRIAGDYADQYSRAIPMTAYEPVVYHLQYPADWQQHGKAAGFVRNQQMLDEGDPDMVVGFSDDLTRSKGTADMLGRAAAAGIPAYVVGRVRLGQ